MTPAEKQTPEPEMAPEADIPTVEETTTVVSGPAATESTAAEGRNQDPWKTAFIILVGVVLLSAVLIYSTSSRRTEPTTVLQADANGQPVQPLNPSSGVEEERLAAMPADAITSNSNIATQPGQVLGGDGYNAWANGGTPPPGAPRVGPGGGYVTVPNAGSQFMPPECIMQPSGIYLCPVPANTNAAVKASPTPKATPQNANVQPSPAPGSTPKASPTPATTRPTPSPRTRPTAAPAKTPAIE